MLTELSDIEYFVEYYAFTLDSAVFLTNTLLFSMKIGLNVVLDYFHIVLRQFPTLRGGRGFSFTTQLGRVHLSIGGDYFNPFHVTAHRKCLTFLISSAFNNFKKIDPI